MTSNSKKLNNEMLLLEKQSDRTIKNEKYYIIFLRFAEGTEGLVNIAKDLLRDKTNQPFVIYLYDNEIMLLFSCRENQEHFLHGSYQALISYYTLLGYKKSGTDLNVKIIEMDTRTQIYTYISWKIYTNSLSTIAKLSNILTTKDVNNKTQQELLDTLKTEDIIWHDVPKHDKYGTLYKLQTKKNKLVILSLSDAFNVKDEQKYKEFIFN